MFGIEEIGSSNNTIGGTTAAARNVISGDSVFLYAGSNNIVQGNYLGTDPSGLDAVGGFADGLSVASETGDLIGGTAPGAGNVISGSSGQALIISGTSAPGITVQGNRIGTDVTGNQSLGNGKYGIFITSPDNTIGGTAPGAGNLISGDGRLAGIRLDGTAAQNNVVQGNLIGHSPSGTGPLGGGTTASNGDGVEITEGASDNMIGGAAAGAANTIAFNAGAGIRFGDAVSTAATGNSIIGNIISSNGADGVIVSSPSRVSAGATIAANTITANAGNGITLTEISGTVISTNTIAGNTGDGVRIDTGKRELAPDQFALRRWQRAGDRPRQQGERPAAGPDGELGRQLRRQHHDRGDPSGRPQYQLPGPVLRQCGRPGLGTRRGPDPAQRGERRP